MINHKKLPSERQAQRFFLKKKWSKAIEEYEKCLTEDANDLSVINLLGDAYLKKRDTDDAFGHYRKALESYEAQGLFDNAIAMAKKISRLDPEDGKIHLKLAQLYTDQAFLSDAITHVKTYKRFVGKKIDETAILGIFQKIAGMTVENPGLWDQIAECYHHLEISDPELDKVMASENFPAASVDKEATSSELLETDQSDDLMPKLTDDIQDDAADLDTQVEESTEALEFSDILDDVLPAEQAEPPSSEAPAFEESEVSELADKTEEQPPPESESPEETVAASLEATEGDTEVSLDAEIPSISSELGDEPTAKPMAMDIDKRDDVLARDTDDDTEVSQIDQQPSDSSDSEEIESGTREKGGDIPITIGREEADTSEAFAGLQEQTGEDSDEEVLWTLPFDVAQESTPDTAEEEASIETTQEQEAVESILTGFSMDETPKPTPKSPAVEKVDTGKRRQTSKPGPKMSIDDQTPESHAAAPSLVQKETVVEELEIAEQVEEDELQEPEPSTSPEPEAATELDSTARQEQERSDSAKLKEDLQSLELSELAELNRDEPRVVTSFDGKEHFEMGKIYKEMKLWDAAIAEFKTAATDPNWRSKSCITLSACFREKGDMALAISQLKWALSTEDEMKEDSDKYDLHYELGTLYELAGDITEARDEFQAVHRWNPSYKGVEKKLLELRKRMQKS